MCGIEGAQIIYYPHSTTIRQLPTGKHGDVLIDCHITNTPPTPQAVENNEQYCRQFNAEHAQALHDFNEEWDKPLSLDEKNSLYNQLLFGILGNALSDGMIPMEGENEAGGDKNGNADGKIEGNGDSSEMGNGVGKNNENEPDELGSVVAIYPFVVTARAVIRLIPEECMN